MLKRRSSVRNCCRIESSNRLKSIFIKFNCFIFLKYFCKGGPGPLGPPSRSATGYYYKKFSFNISIRIFLLNDKKLQYIFQCVQCKSQKISRRPQKPRQGEQLIHNVLCVVKRLS